MKVKKTARNSFLAIAIIILAALVSVSLFVFRRQTLSILTRMSIQNITDIQTVYTQTLKAKFLDQLNMLEAQARFFDDVDLDNNAELKKTITSTKGIGEFKKIAVANSEGVCTSNTGQNLANIHNKDFFYDTIKTGLPQISNKIEVDENLEPILTLTYPIKRNNSIKALITGTLSYNVLKDLFSISIFSGDSYMYIVAQNGNIILCNRDKKKNLYNVNIFDLIKNNTKEDSIPLINKMKIDIIENRSDSIAFNGNDTRKLFTYMPLHLNNWYLISVIPYSYIVKQQFSISVLVYIILGIIVFTVITFIFVVYELIKKASDIEKDNERLTIANSQNQSVIFEYDLQKREVVFSGDTEFIFGTTKNVFSVDFIRTEFYKRIHYDDKTVMSDLRAFIEGSKDGFSEGYSGEFRYKTFKNEFIWLKISGSMITKNEEKSNKFIGTISNVNSQVLHEQELKSIAELDKLTGLLNKNAMESHIKEFLEKIGKQTKCALFIVDLDNFKKVNDSLGHLIGDMAIMDAAKKLSLIFSEKDFISRFGGDEFCVLLRLRSNLDEETVKRIIREKAQNMCTFIREDYFDEKTTISVTASIGIAVYPDNGTDYEELFKKADESLYKVKENGKDGYKIFGVPEDQQ